MIEEYPTNVAGAEVWYRWIDRVCFDESGRATSIVTVPEDISQQRDVALEVSEQATMRIDRSRELSLLAAHDGDSSILCAIEALASELIAAVAEIDDVVQSVSGTADGMGDVVGAVRDVAARLSDLAILEDERIRPSQSSCSTREKAVSTDT